jgi:hypothetical protein
LACRRKVKQKLADLHPNDSSGVGDDNCWDHAQQRLREFLGNEAWSQMHETLANLAQSVNGPE